MSLNYSFIKYKDVYTITNNESLVLGYTLSKETCDTSVTLKTGTVPVGQSVVLDIKVDGNYKFTPYTENENGIKSVSYDSIIGLLIEAIKEQQGLITNIEKKIDLLGEKK